MRFKMVHAIGLVATCFGLSCTKKEETSRLQIQLPGPTLNAQKNLSTSTAVGRVGKLGANWNSAIPSSLSDIGCFGVFVGGAEPEMRTNVCKDGDGSELARFGLMKAFSARGSQIALDVKPGVRNIYILGSKLVSGTCPDVFVGQDPNVAGLSNPYLLGTATVDLKSGIQDVSVNLTANFTSSYKLSDCTFAGGSGGSSNFGTGADGDITFFTDANFNSDYYTLNGINRTISASRRISSISGNTITTATSFATSGQIDFAVGDEVMYIVTAAYKSGGPDGACQVGGISNGLHRGRFGFSRVVAIPDTTHLTLENVITPIPENTNIGASVTNGEPFCALQIVRVPNFNNLSFSNVSLRTMTADAYSSTGVTGGVLAFRVKNTLTKSGAGNVAFDLSGKGFQPQGSNGYSGDGTEGPGTSGYMNNGNAGGGGTIAGAGGGASFGAGAVGVGTSAGFGGYPLTFCSAGGGVGCQPNEKLYFGGSGGRGLTAGGAGGGIIFAAVNSVQRAAGSGNLDFNVNGIGGSSGGGYGGGGGAGGYALIHAKIFDSNSYQFSAQGGNGGSASMNGGPGGGGAVQINYCASSSGDVSLSASTLGAGAAGVGNGSGAGVINPNVCQ